MTATKSWNEPSYMSSVFDDGNSADSVSKTGLTLAFTDSFVDFKVAVPFKDTFLA